MPITKLEQMFDVLKSKGKKRLIAAYANDSHTIDAVSHAIDLGIVEGTLVGDKEIIRQVCKDEGVNYEKFHVIHEPDEIKATMRAIKTINDGDGDILMKGLVSTDKYMRCIFNKEDGLMDAGAILTHVTVMENPNYHKLLIISDVAIIPLPDLKQKITIANYLIKTAHALDIKLPKVALLAASEMMSASMPACVDAAILCKMADRGQIKGGILDGPLALDLCIDQESCQIKGIKSPVAGDADCILFPNIEAANTLYKANTKLSGGEQGAIVCGARKPCVLSSRGDSVKTKLYSIALAALMA
ncbi:MAG: phosphate acyltransferase [Bacteroidia bacterium]|nr:phosphate acyltransferase [Bacteroidia bacterium]